MRSIEPDNDISGALFQFNEAGSQGHDWMIDGSG